MYKGGTSGNAIAVKLGIPRSTVYNILNRFKKRGTVKSKKRTGRPRKLNSHDLRELGRVFKHSRKMKATELSNLIMKDVSTRTIRRRAHEMGYFLRVAAKKPFINEDQRRRRLTFPRKDQDWTVEDWMKVIWTDESSFEIGKISQQAMVWRTPQEKFKPDCLAPTFKSGRASIMIWGAFIGESTSPLVIMPPK